MQQPWDEPAEPIEQAAENLPLAGLLAELLASAEVSADEGAAAAAAAEGDAAAAGSAQAWWNESGAGGTAVADLMRALGEAEQGRQEAAAGNLSGSLLARLTGHQEEAPAGPGPLPPPEGEASTEQPPRAAESAQPEPAPAAGLSGRAGADVEPVPAPEEQAASLPAEQDGGPASAGELSSGSLAQAAPAEALSETAPVGEPADSAVLSRQRAPGEPPIPADACSADAVAEAAASGSGGGVQENAAPVQPGSGAARPGSAAGRMEPSIPVPPPVEEDEFELVDAETAGRMLDQLIDAARSAIRSSLAAPLRTQPSKAEQQPEAPASAAGPGASGAAEPGTPASARQCGRTEGAAGRPRLASERLAFADGELGEEPPPLPPAAALIGMGLPERLRARLERIGDLEKVLAAQSEGAAGKAVDQRSRLLVFRVGEQHYGLPIENVREVERVTRVTPVPGSPRFVRGLVNLRGEILPLLDMRLLLGAEAEGMPSSPRLIVAQAGRQEPPLALMVEELNGLAPLGEETEEPAPPAAGPGAPVCGAVEHRGRRVWRLDPAALLSLPALEDRAELR